MSPSVRTVRSDLAFASDRVGVPDPARLAVVRCAHAPLDRRRWGRTATRPRVLPPESSVVRGRHARALARAPDPNESAAVHRLCWAPRTPSIPAVVTNPRAHLASSRTRHPRGIAAGRTLRRVGCRPPRPLRVVADRDTSTQGQVDESPSNPQPRWRPLASRSYPVSKLARAPSCRVAGSVSGRMYRRRRSAVRSPFGASSPGRRRVLPDATTSSCSPMRGASPTSARTLGGLT